MNQLGETEKLSQTLFWKTENILRNFKLRGRNNEEHLFNNNYAVLSFCLPTHGAWCVRRRFGKSR